MEFPCIILLLKNFVHYNSCPKTDGLMPSEKNSLLKRLWKKFISIFSFIHNVFYPMKDKSNLWINFFSNDKILDTTKLKAVADDNLNIAKMTISLFDRAENTEEKRRKCWLPAFSSFPSVF